MIQVDLVEHVQRAQKGDLDAFCYLATAYRQPALRMARSILGDAHAAEDVTQDALLSAFDRLSDLREPAAFPGWLRAQVRTHALRRARRRREALVEEGTLGLVAAPKESELERLELRQAIRAAIRELDARSQDVIERFYLRGLSIRETANELGLPEGTVKRRLHEARERLRPRLSGLAGPFARPRPQATRTPTRLRFPL